MMVSTLMSVILFCGAISIPLVFAVLFTYSSYEEYVTEDSDSVIGVLPIVGGVMITISSVSFIVAVLIEYMNAEGAVGATAVGVLTVFLGALGIGLEALFERLD